MSKLNEGSITIYDALENIKNGKYVMPAFQRQYVWDMAQIEKLWDSILLDYPIATFLYWHIDENNVTSDTYFCNFLQDVVFNNTKQSDSPNYDTVGVNLDVTDTAILDGQQRLTSLYLSLLGNAFIREKHARKSRKGGIVAKLVVELNKNKADVDEEEYNSKKYDIRYTDKIGVLSPTQFVIRNIIDDKFRDEGRRTKAIEEAISKVPPTSQEYAKNILSKLCTKIYDEKLIRYTEIQDMNQDDALEMFVRFNSGGKALKKHEITMSILEAYWPNAKQEFGTLLTGNYKDFGTDFIIRTALMLYGDVVKSNISKKTADELKGNWENFKDTLHKLEEVLKNLKIDITRFAGSWNVLLPIIYLIYVNPNYMDCKEGIRAYIVRAVLFTYFQSGTTGKLQQMKSNINNYNYEITVDMLEQITDLRVTDGKIDDILNSEKSSRVAAEALYYLSLDWYNKKYKYEEDHLHPYERFEEAKPFTLAITQDEWRRWGTNRNRLPNLWLFEGRGNASKSDMPLQEFYDEMNAAQQELFKTQAMIPKDVSFDLASFPVFYEKRKQLLCDKLKKLLS